MILVDKDRKILVVRRGSVLTKNVRFDGTIVAGISCSFLGNVEGYEVKLSKHCTVGGIVRCTRAIVGACSEFNVIEAEDVILLRGCRGKRIYATGDVKVASNCIIGEIYAGRNLVIEGNSKIGKMEARRIVAVNDQNAFI